MYQKCVVIENQLVMNNLGGWRKVELLLLDEFERLVIGKNGAVVIPKEGTHVLPHHRNGVQLVATPKVDENGCLYTHSCSIELRSSKLSSEYRSILQRAAHCGCILIGTTNNGDSYLFGDKDTPLTGTFGREHGKRPSDLHECVLSVSTASIHPELPLI